MEHWTKPWPENQIERNGCEYRIKSEKLLSTQDLHLHSLLQVSTLKARLKLKGELCLIGIVGSVLNGPTASSDTWAGEIGTLVGFKVWRQKKIQVFSKMICEEYCDNDMNNTVPMHFCFWFAANGDPNELTVQTMKKFKKHGFIWQKLTLLQLMCTDNEPT